jgi:hypothetical protein
MCEPSISLLSIFERLPSIYAKSGVANAFKVVDAKRGKFSVDNDEELKFTAISAIEENSPTTRRATKEFFEKQVIPSLLSYKDPDE